MLRRFHYNQKTVIFNNKDKKNMKKIIKGILLIGFLASVGTKASILQRVYNIFKKPSLLSFLTTGSNFQSKPNYVINNNLQKIYDRMPQDFDDIITGVIKRMPEDKILKLNTEFSSESPDRTVDAKFDNLINMVTPYMTQEERFKICKIIEYFKIFNKTTQNFELYGLPNSKIELLAIEVDKNNDKILNIIVNIPNQGKKRIKLNDLKEHEVPVIFCKIFSHTLEKMDKSLGCSKCIRDLFLEDYK